MIKFFIRNVHLLSILFFSSMFMNCTYAVNSHEAKSIDQNNKITKTKQSNDKNSTHNSLTNSTNSTNSTNENIIFINRRTSSFNKIKNFIPKIHSSLKRKKSKRQNTSTNNSFKSYINYSSEQIPIESLNIEKNQDDISNYSFDSSPDSYNQTPDSIEGDSIYSNRFIGKIIQLTSDNQPYLIEVQEESPSKDSYMDMGYFFINRIANLIPKTPYNFFYKGYYAPQTIILGSTNLCPDSENNKIIYDDKNCIYESIMSTTYKKVIHHMMLRTGEPFKNIHTNIEIEPHVYYIRGMYLSICILKKIQLTIIYPEKNVSHNTLEINNLTLDSVSQYFKNIFIPIESSNKINKGEYKHYEKQILFMIESQREIFDNLDTIVLELGNPSLYGLKIMNIQMDYNFIEALNKLKISLYAFESKKPENIHNRKIIYEYNGYYILAISIFFDHQRFTRYIKINGFEETTSEEFDLITDHIKYIINDTFKGVTDKDNIFVILLSLLVCYNQTDNLVNHDDNATENNLKLELSTEFGNLHDIEYCAAFIQDSKILQFGEFIEDTDILQFGEFIEDTDSLQFGELIEDTRSIQFGKLIEDTDSIQFGEFTEDIDSIQSENLTNFDKSDKIYENLPNYNKLDNIYEKLPSFEKSDHIYENLPNCNKSDNIYEYLPNSNTLDNIYENSNIYLRQNKDITEIYNIEDIIKDIDLIAISIPTLLIINIINSKLL